MLEKILILIILIEVYFATIIYDEEINSTATITYMNTPKYPNRIYKLNKYKNYYEIYNMNITLKIYKGDNLIKILENNLEEAFYFKYNDNEEYYISAEFPSTCDLCGFIVSSEDHELNILSDEYTTNLYFGRYRNFSLKIKNKENSSQILKIKISLKSDKYGVFHKAYFEENGTDFIPFSTSDYVYNYSRSNTSYPIISDELIFKPEFMYQFSSQQKFYYEVGIEVNYINNVISKNYTQCIPKNKFAFYKLNNPSNDTYEISFLTGSLIYLMKNNLNKLKLNSINKYNINDYDILFVDSSNNEGCFSIIFSDEKNYMSPNTDYKLTLFDSRDYTFYVTNNQKYLQINYLKNDYFNVSLYVNGSTEIKYKFLKFNKYLFIFENTFKESLFKFKFEKNKVLDMNYYDIEFFYFGLDEDINTEIINENTFNCIKKTSFYNLTFNSDKKYIYFLTNDSSIVYLDDKSITSVSSEYNFFKLENNKNLDFYADNNEHINCFELKYETNYESFDIESFEDKNFTLVSDNTFVFNLKNLIKNLNYKIIIKSKKNNIQIDKYELDSKTYDYDGLISFISTKETSKLKFQIKLKEKNVIDDMNIFFYYEENIENDFSICIDSTHYYMLKKNDYKKNIYILINNKEDTFLDNSKISDLDNENNFYELNTDKRLEIYANKDNIICFDLKYEKNNGFFEYEKGKNKKFDIVSDTNLEFNLVNLEKNVKYNIEINSKNVQINYYKLGNQHYDFQKSIIFTSESNKIKFEIPIILKIDNDNNNIGKIDLFYTNIEMITQNSFKCIKNTEFYNIKIDSKKPYIFFLSNDSSNTYLNNAPINTIENYNNFYNNIGEGNLHIYSNDEKIICYELKYNGKDIFQIEPGTTEMEFNIFYFDSVNLEFNLVNLDTEKEQTIKLEASNYYNVKLNSYYIDDEEYEFIKSYSVNFKINKKEAKIRIPVCLDYKNELEKLKITFFINKTPPSSDSKTNYLPIIIIIIIILIIILLTILIYNGHKNDLKKRKDSDERLKKQIELKGKIFDGLEEKEDENKIILKKEKEILERFYEVILKYPKEINKVCPNCYKFEFYGEKIPKNQCKASYIYDVRREINGYNFNGVKQYLKDSKCEHFYCSNHKKDKCYLCDNFMTAKNFTVFLEPDKKSFFQIIEYINGETNKRECQYKNDVINAVYRFIENDEEIRENIKIEVKKRRDLELKFKNDLCYFDSFEIKLDSDYEMLLEKYETKMKEKKERKEQERKEKEKEKEYEYEIKNLNKIIKNKEIINQKNNLIEQNKKVKLRICYNSKCSGKCFICRGKVGGISTQLYCHQRCWDLNNCFVCGKKSQTDCNRNVCYDCLKYGRFRREWCAVCKQKL